MARKMTEAGVLYRAAAIIQRRGAQDAESVCKTLALVAEEIQAEQLGALRSFDYDAFRAAVEDAKAERRATWADVARQAGIADDTIRNYTMGRSASTDTLVRLLVWLGDTDIKPYLRS